MSAIRVNRQAVTMATARWQDNTNSLFQLYIHRVRFESGSDLKTKHLLSSSGRAQSLLPQTETQCPRHTLLQTQTLPHTSSGSLLMTVRYDSIRCFYFVLGKTCIVYLYVIITYTQRLDRCDRMWREEWPKVMDKGLKCEKSHSCLKSIRRSTFETRQVVLLTGPSSSSDGCTEKASPKLHHTVKYQNRRQSGTFKMSSASFYMSFCLIQLDIFGICGNVGILMSI